MIPLFLLRISLLAINAKKIKHFCKYLQKIGTTYILFWYLNERVFFLF